MRPYKTLLLALGFFFTVQCHIFASASSFDIADNNQNGVRLLRSPEKTDEERGAVDALKSELSFMKLNWAARSKITPKEKLVAKQAKEMSNTKEKLSKIEAKLQAKAVKAEQKVKDQAIKAEQNLKAKNEKAAQQLKALEQNELEKLAKQAAKEDKMYNRWLMAEMTPDDVYKKFKFEELAKKGIYPTTSVNYKHYKNYRTIYYARYPKLLEKLDA
ncbi:hypothetical protein PInf_020052 [Phytophthora infestans]|nr:hypothetical protein PInf_020052 [Phytophthora infestans]